jgi:site-specific DNA-methyltransferase (adenine-specific)
MITILSGDCKESMKTIESNSINCCITSPPYYGLRDYNCEGQAGLEATPEEYIANMVKVFREVKRLLRDDGTLWVNIGDSYATGTNAPRTKGNRGIGDNTQAAQDSVPRVGNPNGCKTKDLIGIPWMLAFALRADGWYLRQDIIWHKPNPMPESVKDRCTKSHEYIFLLSKSPKYYFDSDAIRQSHKRIWDSTNGGNLADVGHKKAGKIETKNTHPKGYPLPNPLGANKRSVWTVTTKPYNGAHFATFPPDLIEPCVLAGCPEGGTVIDPFGGSGTVAGVAVKHNRLSVLCELNTEYHTLIRDRVLSISGYDMNTGTWL